MKNVSKASKIRALLAEGVSVKDIANKLNYTESYVAQVKWHWKKAGAPVAKSEMKSKKTKAKKKQWKTKKFTLPVSTPNAETRKAMAEKPKDDFSSWLRGRLNELKQMRAEDEAAMSVGWQPVGTRFGDAQPKQEGEKWTDDPLFGDRSEWEDRNFWWLDPTKSLGKAMDGFDSRDMVNSPDHYTTGGIETIDFIEAKKLGYHLGNVVKYVSRAPHKGRHLEDLKKARWYLDREIENLEDTSRF